MATSATTKIHVKIVDLAAEISTVRRSIYATLSESIPINDQKILFGACLLLDRLEKDTYTVAKKLDNP